MVYIYYQHSPPTWDPVIGGQTVPVSRPLSQMLLGAQFITLIIGEAAVVDGAGTGGRCGFGQFVAFPIQCVHAALPCRLKWCHNTLITPCEHGSVHSLSLSLSIPVADMPEQTYLLASNATPPPPATAGTGNSPAQSFAKVIQSKCYTIRSNSNADLDQRIC